MKSALLVIDVQHAFFAKEPRPFVPDEVVRNINIVTERARKADVSVIFIQHECDGSVVEHGAEGWHLQADIVAHTSDSYFGKTTPDSFLRTGLSEFLKSKEISNVVVCGYASEFCVDTTVRRAAALGYSVQLVADAHTTHDKEHATAKQIRTHHNATLPNITSFGVSITAVNTGTVLF